MMKKERHYEEQLQSLNPESITQNMDKHYSDKRFWRKVMKYGKLAGEKTVYYSLLLYYTAKNPAVPQSSKLIILGALGYLIFPVDLIPDFIPVVGLADDAAVIAAAVYKVISHIDDNVRFKAKTKMKRLFGSSDDYEGLDKELIN